MQIPGTSKVPAAAKQRGFGGRMLSHRVHGAQNWAAFHATRVVDSGDGAVLGVWCVVEICNGPCGVQWDK